MNRANIASALGFHPRSENIERAAVSTRITWNLVHGIVGLLICVLCGMESAYAVNYNIATLNLPTGANLTGFNDLGEVSYYTLSPTTGLPTTYTYNIYTRIIKKIPVPDNLTGGNLYYAGFAINDSDDIFYSTYGYVWLIAEFSKYNIVSGNTSNLSVSDIYPCEALVRTSNNAGLVGGTYLAGNGCGGGYPYIYNIGTSTFTPLGLYRGADGWTLSINDAGLVLVYGGNCAAADLSYAYYCVYNSSSKKYYKLPNGQSAGYYLYMNNNNKILCRDNIGTLCIFDLNSGSETSIVFDELFIIRDFRLPTYLNINNVIVGTYLSTDGLVKAFIATPDATSPEIIFDGVNVTEGLNVAGTSTPPSVVVGQQVILEAVLPKSFGPVASQKWLVGGKPIGGYEVTSTPLKHTGSVSSWVSNQAVTQLYWTVPTDAGAYNTVEYAYTLKSGQTGTIETKFTVTPPPTPNVTAVEKTAGVSCAVAPTYCDIFYDTVNNKQVLYMGFGRFDEVSSNIGITFSPSTSAGSGKFEWVQIVEARKIITTLTSGKVITCDYSRGLDEAYPYSLHIDTNDNPATPLFSNEKTRSDQFSARMYLLWTSDIPASIPVPLGSITWGFDERSEASSDAPFAGWTTPVVTSSHGVFVASTQTYPTWEDLSKTKPCQ